MYYDDLGKNVALGYDFWLWLAAAHPYNRLGLPVDPTIQNFANFSLMVSYM